MSVEANPPESQPKTVAQSIPERPFPAQNTPWQLRATILAAVTSLATLAYLAEPLLGSKGRAVLGLLCFLGVAAAFSFDLKQVSWRTVLTGLGLQVLLAVLVLKVEPVYLLFNQIGLGISKFLSFSAEGSKFVFGKLADPAESGFIFAFAALPPIIFVSSFFTILYHLGILQVLVRAMAVVMARVMGVSGGESLSASANVFMGQTEAPLIVKPYVPRMTQSELLALMVGGMATVSGGIMAALIGLFPKESQKDIAVAILTTSVMAAPCGLYLSKLLLPETEESETKGEVKAADVRPHANVVDAAAGGASDGMQLALNVAAMLIAFIALIAFADAVLGGLYPGASLKYLFSRAFYFAAVLIGVPMSDVPAVAELLGTKLALNEFVAFIDLSKMSAEKLSPEGRRLAFFALTSFANFASIGIQLGGIGALAPSRRKDLARLSGHALLAGFLATLVNASVAAIVI